VINATGGAHNEGAEREEEEGAEIGKVGADTPLGKRHRPEAGNGEQPDSGRPVDAGEAQIGDKRLRREPVDRVVEARVGDRAAFAFGKRTWHVFRSRRLASMRSPESWRPSLSGSSSSPD